MLAVATPATAQSVRAEVVASDLDSHWALAFLPKNHFLATERPGRMRVISPDGSHDKPISGLPAIAAGGQGNSTALARATLSADNTALQNLKVIFSQKPKAKSRRS